MASVFHHDGAQFDRRTLLKAAALGGAMVAMPRLGGGVARGAPPPDAAVTPVNGAALERWSAPFPSPTTRAAASLGDLTMAEATHTFHPALGPSPSWGYGGASYLGPTIEAQSGQPLQFTARNRLGAHILRVDPTMHGARPSHQQRPPVSLHKHGGYTASQYDGLPEDTFLPGADHSYVYGNRQRAGTIWYHDHALGITRLNVYAGLAGFYLMRDEFDTGKPGNPAGLPTGAYEIPLVLQDKVFAELKNSPGQFVQWYPFPWEPEFFGDTAVINGAAWPYREVEPAVYRFRLLNGSSSRFYSLRLEGDASLHVVGTDTGLLNAPHPMTEPLVIAPGERYDTLIDFREAADSTVHLTDGVLPADVVSPAPGPLGQLVQFRVGADASPDAPTAVPDAFVLQPGVPTATAPERNLSLVEILGGPHPKVALLNNLHWDTPRGTWEQPRADKTEIWNIHNATADTHPIHLHLVQFRLLERRSFDVPGYLQTVYNRDYLRPGDAGRGPWPPPQGTWGDDAQGPHEWENGWKDTIQANPGQVTRIVVPFGPGAAKETPYTGTTALSGEYVWHCHILDHEDHEMMLPYTVMPPGEGVPQA